MRLAFDPILSVFGGRGEASLACDDDTCAPASKLEADVEEGIDLLIAIVGFRNATNNYALNIEVIDVPRAGARPRTSTAPTAPTLDDFLFLLNNWQTGPTCP